MSVFILFSFFCFRHLRRRTDIVQQVNEMYTNRFLSLLAVCSLACFCFTFNKRRVHKTTMWRQRSSSANLFAGRFLVFICLETDVVCGFTIEHFDRNKMARPMKFWSLRKSIVNILNRRFFFNQREEKKKEVDEERGVDGEWSARDVHKHDVYICIPYAHIVRCLLLMPYGFGFIITI